MPATLPRTDALKPVEAALARAIDRTARQRWLTLEHLLDRFLNRPCRELEPAMRAVLLAGAAQLVFMQRLPAYAVVDQMVELAERLMRRKARGMVNAVLRKIAGLVGAFEPDEPWTPAVDALPMDDGKVRLTEPCLPDPIDEIAHLSLATSHPQWLVRRWRRAFGRDAVVRMCLTGVRSAPTIVAVENDFSPDTAHDDWQWHDAPGFIVWRGDYQALRAFLDAHPHRRVQDPAAQRAVAACDALHAPTILDFCAGRGTKTVQLAAAHPQARIFACDPDPDRAASLRQVSARFEHVAVIDHDAARAMRADLLVLDVPCSNTGVLGRRPEARYRLSSKRLKQVVALQRDIFAQALPTVTPGGHVLYSTCSVEAEENAEQAGWLEQRLGTTRLRESLTLPAGADPSHHDGGYHALLPVPVPVSAAASGTGA